MGYTLHTNPLGCLECARGQDMWWVAKFRDWLPETGEKKNGRVPGFSQRRRGAVLYNHPLLCTTYYNEIQYKTNRVAKNKKQIQNKQNFQIPSVSLVSPPVPDFFVVVIQNYPHLSLSLSLPPHSSLFPVPTFRVCFSRRISAKKNIYKIAHHPLTPPTPLSSLGFFSLFFSLSRAKISPCSKPRFRMEPSPQPTILHMIPKKKKQKTVSGGDPFH